MAPCAGQSEQYGHASQGGHVGTTGRALSSGPPQEAIRSGHPTGRDIPESQTLSRFSLFELKNYQNSQKVQKRSKTPKTLNLIIDSS